MKEKTLRTRLCDILNIEYPIILAGMGGVCGPTLVAVVMISLPASDRSRLPSSSTNALSAPITSPAEAS